MKRADLDTQTIQELTHLLERIQFIHTIFSKYTRLCDTEGITRAKTIGWLIFSLGRRILQPTQSDPVLCASLLVSVLALILRSSGCEQDVKARLRGLLRVSALV